MKIHSLSFDSKTKKIVDNGCVEMSKREIKVFKDYEKRKKEV